MAGVMGVMGPVMPGVGGYRLDVEAGNMAPPAPYPLNEGDITDGVYK